MAHPVGVEVALVPGVEVGGDEAGRGELLVVVVPGHIPGDRPDPEAPFPEPLRHPEDEEGLPRPDRPHHVERPYLPLLEELVVAGGELQLPLEDVLGPDPDVVHTGPMIPLGAAVDAVAWQAPLGRPVCRGPVPAL